MSTSNSENKYKIDASANTITEHKQRKTFKEYYQDPEFKQRHNAYIKESVICGVCNCYIKRYNSGHHKSSQKHKKNLEKKQQESKKISKEEVIQLIEKLQKLL
jgi:hypothetical protein